jgi:glycyl-tRNA synthetase beta chain
MNEKVARIETLAVEIAKAVGYTNEPAVRRAAKLCKADLTSGMVGEFPELQGIMGRYYATAQGESAEIADAIRDHYKPLGASDSVPESPLAAIIAIADKLDSITSLFAAGEKPTGSKDPLALRRAALGIVRIMLYHNWGFDLASRGASPEVSEFLRERLKVLLRDENIRHDAVDAVFAKTIAINPPVLVTHIKALAAWLTTDAGTTTLAAIKRAMNILAAEEKKSKTTFAAGFSDKLTSPAEKALVAALKIAPKSPADLDALAAPIQQFFTDHMVNDENPAIREARLSLLAAVRDAANAIADFSKIEG